LIHNQIYWLVLRSKFSSHEFSHSLGRWRSSGMGLAATGSNRANSGPWRSETGRHIADIQSLR
jgi:hypothetical protein